MRSLFAALALTFQAGLAGATPLELPESVRTALASARAAQKEHRNEDAVLAARAALVRAAGDTAVESWHLAPLLRTMSEAYEQAGSMELAARTMALASEAAQAAPDELVHCVPARQLPSEPLVQHLDALCRADRGA